MTDAPHYMLNVKGSQVQILSARPKVTTESATAIGRWLKVRPRGSGPCSPGSTTTAQRRSHRSASASERCIRPAIRWLVSPWASHCTSSVRQHHDAGSRVLTADRPGGLHAGHHRHVEVHEHRVGAERGVQVRVRTAVGRLPHHLQVLAHQEGDKRRPSDRIVLHDQGSVKQHLSQVGNRLRNR